MCVAVPRRVKEVSGGWAVLDTPAGPVRARTDLVPVEKGDYVLVHAGFIIQKLDPAEARRTVTLFQEILSR